MRQSKSAVIVFAAPSSVPSSPFPALPTSTPADSARPDPVAPDAPLPESYRGLDALQQEFRRYQEAAFPRRSPRFFALELAGEAGELANLEKKAWKGRSVAPEQFADEVADVCIALLNFANSREIDVAAAVKVKMSRIDALRRAEPETLSADSAE